MITAKYLQFLPIGKKIHRKIQNLINRVQSQAEKIAYYLTACANLDHGSGEDCLSYAYAKYKNGERKRTSKID